MCLSNVYKTTGDEETLVCEYVSNISVEGENVIITDVLGKEITVPGTLLKVDLIKNIVMIKSA